MQFAKLRVIAFWAVTLAALPALSANAQTVQAQTVQAQTAQAQTPSDSEAAFQAVLEDPGSLDKNVTYAQALIAEGDIEGAIAVLERLVLLFPDRAELHVTLGQLYQRIGSDAAAAQAYDSALAAPATTPQVKAQAEALRDEALDKTAASHLSGSLFAGMQYQTNANAGPNSNDILSGGSLVDRPGADRPNDDISGVFGFNLNHTYDFGRQDAMALESQLSGFGALYDQEDELNTGRISGQVGLGFAPFPGDGGFFRLQPRVNFEAVMTDGEWLEGGGGPGVGVTFVFNDTLGLDVGYDAIYRHFDHVETLGDTEQYTGFEHQAVATLTWLARPGTTVIGSLGGRAADTKRDFRDYKGLQASAGVYQTYGSPLSFLPRDWLAGLSAGYEARWYDSADPSVNDDITRQDDIFQFDAVNTIPLSESWSVTQQVQYLLDDSNLRNYSYDNLTVAMSARWRF
jgi:tetratricopeptide (TPR) repeat protein